MSSRFSLWCSHIGAMIRLDLPLDQGEPPASLRALALPPALAVQLRLGAPQLPPGMLGARGSHRFAVRTPCSNDGIDGSHHGHLSCATHCSTEQPAGTTCNPTGVCSAAAAAGMLEAKRRADRTSSDNIISTLFLCMLDVTCDLCPRWGFACACMAAELQMLLCTLRSCHAPNIDRRFLA